MKNKNRIMKKLFLILFAVGMLSVSCGTKTTETETVEGDTTMTVMPVDTNVCADTVVTDTVE